MSKRNPTVEEYLAGVNEDLQNGMAYDHVASFAEWLRFKQALMQWIDKQEADWDQVAREQEHDGTPDE